MKVKFFELLKKTKTLLGSAVFALLITLIMFFIQERENSRQLDKIQSISENLSYVQNSLTTRYLGTYPSYVGIIETLFNEVLKSSSTQRDSIVVFEDVLYYGIVSKPSEFIRINDLLIQLAKKGYNITIAFYDTHGRQFSSMIEQEYISPQYFIPMQNDIREVIHNGSRKGVTELIDSIVESYFSTTKNKSFESFTGKFKKYQNLRLVKTAESMPADIDSDIISTCLELDSVTDKYIRSSNPNDIKLSEMKSMYASFSEIMKKLYENNGINVIPINESLTVSCWMVGNKAIIGFPSKYASDEIAFISEDNAFNKYIVSILNGIISNNKISGSNN